MNLSKFLKFSKNSKLNQEANYLSSIKKIWDLYEKLPMPFCIISEDSIVYSNKIFKNRFANEYNIKITDLFENFNINYSRQLIRFKKTSYNVTVQSINEYQNNVFLVFFNESIYKDAVENIVEQEMCIGYIILDNYEEAFEQVEDIKVSVVLAIIEKRLKTFVTSINGLIQKYDKDRFVIVFAKEYLDQLKRNNFSIQSQLKEIDVGLKMPITISVGLGHSSDNLSVLSDYAMSALDLALGRGGDQVVIKTENEYEYFGESRQEASQNSRVKARVKAHAFSELILDYDNILIMGHKSPDLDCLGASIGVNRIVKSVNASCNCQIVVDENISTSVSSLYNSISQNKEYKENVFITNKTAISVCDEKTLLIVLDVYIAPITQCPELLNITPNIVIFDHHRKSSNYISNELLLYHNSSASSTCELVTEMMMYIKSPINILPIEADALLAGITVDTKGFQFKASSKTFDCASFLKKCGANSHNIHLLLQNDIDIYKARANAVKDATTYKKSIAYAIVEDVTDNPKLVVAQAADELLNLRDIRTSFTLCKVDDTVLISFRSLGDLNVQIIAEHFGGGGHRTIAACIVPDAEINSLIIDIKKEINKQIQEEN